MINKQATVTQNTPWRVSQQQIHHQNDNFTSSNLSYLHLTINQTEMKPARLNKLSPTQLIKLELTRTTNFLVLELKHSKATWYIFFIPPSNPFNDTKTE
jgi:hypothetical protein